MMRPSTAAALYLLCFGGVPARADLTVSFGAGATQFGMDLVTIGDPGNAADGTGAPKPAGSVGYVYNIGKYEVSRDMVTKANKEGRLRITLESMSFVPGGARPDMPATGVSWNEAARFINWLNSSHGFPAAYKFSLQPGDRGYNANADIELWVNGDPGFDAANPFRNRQAKYFLPSTDEWYKAAYYDPAANAGAGGYWDFPTGSDTAPVGVSSGTDANTAVYMQSFAQGPADVTQAGGLSPYGVMGMGGNVNEWEETERDLTNDTPYGDRSGRGANWFIFPENMSASGRNSSGSPYSEFVDMGFRVASIPEPNSLGDFNGDGRLDVLDIEVLIGQAAAANHLPRYDLNVDALVNQGDVEVWIKDLFGSWFGDANLDGEFNSGDFTLVFLAGEYEDAIEDNSGWAEGDWDGDGDFTSQDMVKAFLDGGYEQGPRAAAAVPEPSATWLLLAGGLLLVRRGRRPYKALS